MTYAGRITSSSKYENLTVYTGHLVLRGQSIRGGCDGLTVHAARIRTRRQNFDGKTSGKITWNGWNEDGMAT
jgi:hypothetical protein